MSAPATKSAASISRLRLTLVAATLGWALDAFDFTLFLFAIPQITASLGFETGFAGFIVTCTLISSAAGGIIFGVLADRYGRARMLGITILVFSMASLGSATAQNGWQLLGWRCLLGIGMGGEWATGATLVAETWPPEKRNKALAWMQSGWAIGFIFSALVSQWILPQWGWRVLFAAGALPALATLWIRARVGESDEWRQASTLKANREHDAPLKMLWDRRWRKTFLIATMMVAFVMCGVWGFFTWIPSFLSSPVEKGGAGLSFLKSVNWIIALQVGAFFGYVSFGWVADWMGRKRAYAFYVIMAAVLAPFFVHAAKAGTSLILLGPLIGLFGHGHFSALAPMLSELFPVQIRATAQSAIYNIGRGISSGAPWLIGELAERFGFTAPMLSASGFFLLAGAIVFVLPEPQPRLHHD